MLQIQHQVQVHSELSLIRDITGADANYIGQIKFTADNDANQSVNFAKLQVK